MGRVSFLLNLYCFTTKNEIGYIHLNNFSEVLIYSDAIKNHNRIKNINEKDRTDEELKLYDRYIEILYMVEVDSEETVYVIDGVDGIECIYESEEGMEVTVKLSDYSGESGSHKLKCKG